MMSLRQTWSNRMGYFGLTFADTRQVYPKKRDKNFGGTVRPSSTTETHNQLETTDMETTSQNGSTTDRPFNMSPEEARKLVGDLTNELVQNRKLSTRVINAAVIASGVGVGTGVALTVFHFATKK